MISHGHNNVMIINVLVPIAFRVKEKALIKASKALHHLAPSFLCPLLSCSSFLTWLQPDLFIVS